MILVCGRKLQKTTLQATLCVTGSYRAQMRSCEKPAGRQQEVAAAARLYAVSVEMRCGVRTSGAARKWAVWGLEG